MVAELDIRQLSSKFNKTIRQGQDLCGLLERGQAQEPLKEHFLGLGFEAENSPFLVSLVGLNIDSRSMALAWLCEQDFNLFSINLPGHVGLVDILLQEQGYAFEKPGAKRLEFNTLEPFLKALSKADLIREGDGGSWVDPLKLGLEAPQDQQGLKISMPENLQMLEINPALMSRLAATSSLLLIAGPHDYELSETELELLGDLANSFELVFPIITDTKDTLQSKDGWWDNPSLFKESNRLFNVFIDPANPPLLPELFSDSKNELRRSTVLLNLCKKLLAASDMVCDRQRQEDQQLESRKLNLSRKLKSLDNKARESNIKHEFDAVKSAFQMEISELSDGIIEKNKKATLPSGQLSLDISELINVLTEGDLLKDIASKYIKLSVNDEFLNSLTEKVVSLLRKQLREDMVMIRDGVSLIQNQIEDQLSNFRGAAVSLDLPLPEEDKIRQSVSESVDVTIKYRGELPKRGLAQRLSEGRRPAFMILMGISMFGGIFGVNRGAMWISGLMLCLFIGGFIYTFISWKKEDADRIEKELDRIKDTLSGDVKRLINEVQREKLSRLSSYFKDIERKLHKESDDLFRATAKEKDGLLEKEKNDIRGRLKNIDQRIREISSYKRMTLDLNRDSKTMYRDLIKLIQNYLRTYKGATHND